MLKTFCRGTGLPMMPPKTRPLDDISRNLSQRRSMSQPRNADLKARTDVENANDKFLRERTGNSDDFSSTTNSTHCTVTRDKVHVLSGQNEKISDVRERNDENFHQSSNHVARVANMHLKKSSKKRVQCSQCDKSFSQISHLNVHVASVHDKKKPHKCTQCDKGFSQSSNMRRHIATVHEKTTLHRCSQCEKRFSLKSNLKAHILTVHGKVTPYKCTLCDKEFPYRSTLKVHIASVHEKKKPHKCPHCDKSFSQGSGLNSHVSRIHDKKKSFRCTQCKKNFSQKSHMLSHINVVHMKLKTHKCSFSECGQTFSQRAHLNRHHATCHDDAKPHRCRFCSYTFVREHALKTHIDKVHCGESHSKQRQCTSVLDF